MTKPLVTPAARPARTSDLLSPAYRAMVVGLVLTVTLVAVEALAIGTVMPIVAGELRGLELYGWVFSAFFLGNLIGIVLAGGALDRMPLVRPFAAGMGLFALGLAIGGLAPSMPVLVLGRFVQGLGAGAVSPTAYVAIGRTLPESLRPRMFAILSTAWVVPGVIGPSIAAVVGEVLGWRWVFLGLLPLLAVAVALALYALRAVPDAEPASPEHQAAANAVRRLPNALLVAAGAGILVAALTAPEPVLLVVGSAAGLAILLPAFRRLTPAGTLVLAAGLPAAVLLRGLLTFAFFGPDAYLPLVLQDWRETSPALTGLAYTAATLSWTAGSWLQARRIDRLGPAPFVTVGFGTVTLGTVATAAVLLRTVPPEVAVATWALTGLGMGFAYSAFTVIVLRDAAPAEQGQVTSALQLSETLGTALGIGLSGAFVAAAARAGVGEALGIALAAVFGLGVAAAVVGALGSRRLRTRRAEREARARAGDGPDLCSTEAPAEGHVAAKPGG